MDPRRAQTERNAHPAVGASFVREGGQVLFQFVIDPGNVVGPRPATRRDQEQHAGAWAAFIAAEGVSPLDRDAQDGSGGSLPVESPIPEVPVETALEAGPDGDGNISNRRGFAEATAKIRATATAALKESPPDYVRPDKRRTKRKA